MKKLNLWPSLSLALLFLLVFVPNANAKRIVYYFYFDSARKSVYEDDNVRVYMEYDEVYVSNKTDKAIFIDRANSYGVCNGSYDRLFTNTATTTGTSSSSGVAVNLGAASPYLSGITVSGGSGNFQQTTTYDTRIISLPPHTYTPIYKWKHPYYLMEDKGSFIGHGSLGTLLTPKSRYVEQGTGRKIKPKKGFVRNYDPSNTPLRLSAHVTYALSEDLKDAKEVKTGECCLRALVVDNPNGYDKDGYKKENLPYCRPYMEDTDNYTFWAKFCDGEKWGNWELTGVMLGGTVAVVGGIFLFM